MFHISWTVLTVLTEFSSVSSNRCQSISFLECAMTHLWWSKNWILSHQLSNFVACSVLHIICAYSHHTTFVRWTEYLCSAHHSKNVDQNWRNWNQISL